MSRQSRETLKAYFRAGARPSEQDFADLIDSTLNINDEGFRKTPPDGLRISTLGDSRALLSFYTPRSEGDQAEWSFALGDDYKRLSIQRPGVDGAPLMTLSPDGRMGVGTTSPQDDLDVPGVVRTGGRRGQEATAQMVGGAADRLVADGKFHALTPDLHGCHAFEVVAGVGLPETGRFAILHAVALNAFNPIWWDNLFGLKKRIRHHHAYYLRSVDRLQLRWVAASDNPARGHGEMATYQLKIRTRRDYLGDRRLRGEVKPEDEVPIRAYVTKLWFDDMAADAHRAGGNGA
jgi:hypothetical protein